jgi:hypothetical protein
MRRAMALRDHLPTSRLVEFLAARGHRRRFKVINCAQTPGIIPKLLSNQIYIKIKSSVSQTRLLKSP